ncbi:MAG: glycosyltransferase family 9 protein [Gammaproteobacteria bacterium]
MNESILIIKLGALGDVAMATALVARIRAHHAGAPVTLLTTATFAPLFARAPGLEVHVTERRGVCAQGRLLRWMRRARFSRIYDLQGNDRTALWCALSGVRERVGNHPGFPYTHHPAEPWRGQSHIFERMNAVLASAGVAPAPAQVELPAGENERAQVRAWMHAQGLADGGFALLHAGASARRLAGKRWPHYAALGRMLQARGLTPVWIGAGADADANRALAAAVGIDACDRFGIVALAELGRHARVALGNDSGPMHVLAAAPIPIYAFFGKTDWRRNHALGHAARVFANPDLEAISPQQVIDRLAADGVLPG